MKQERVMASIACYVLVAWGRTLYFTGGNARGRYPTSGRTCGRRAASSCHAAVTEVSHSVDELAVAGGLVEVPIQLVKCKTVAIEVPAEAEIVFEGIAPTGLLEPKSPFGESHGHMNLRQLNPSFEVRAITYSKNPVWSSWISQATPSDSSCIKRDAYESLFYNHLRHECVLEV